MRFVTDSCALGLVTLVGLAAGGTLALRAEPPDPTGVAGAARRMPPADMPGAPAAPAVPDPFGGPEVLPPPRPAVPVVPQALPDLSGYYEVQGVSWESTEDGSPEAYDGTAILTRLESGRYRVVLVLRTGSVTRGLGTFDGQTLRFVWAASQRGVPMMGLTTYSLSTGGVLEGGWETEGSRRGGNPETLTPLKKGHAPRAAAR
jgi:hypothetical protein